MAIVLRGLDSLEVLDHLDTLDFLDNVYYQQYHK